jgi:hypothetical protein
MTAMACFLKRWGAAVAVMLELASVCSAAVEPIALTLENKDCCDRHGAVITSGIPFPMGAARSNAVFQLENEIGERIPIQTEPLAIWRDGSLKWLLLDFQASVPKAGLKKFKLTEAKENGPALKSALKISESPERFVINTGPLEFEISKNRFGVLEHLRLDQNGDGRLAPAEQGSISGLTQRFIAYSSTSTNRPTEEQIRQPAEALETLAPQAPADISLEQSGPLRATFKLAGWLHSASGKPMVQYILRVTVFAGSSSVQLDYTMTQLSDLKMLWARDASLQFHLNKPGKTSFIFDGLASAPMGAERLPAQLSQFEESEFAVVSAGGEIAGKGLKAPGWLWTGSKENGGFLLAVKDFWQQFPKALSISSNAVEAQLYPADFSTPLDMDQGLSKTHELLLHFTTGDFNPKDVSDILSDFESPMFAIADPEYYAATKVFGDIATFDFDLFPDYETLTEASGDGFIKRMAAGFRNWGDVYNGGEYKGKNSYMNLEYDVTHNFLVQFARTGLPKYLDAARKMALHQADIDTNHKTGWQWKHSPRHVEIQAEFGHTFTRGLLETYFLTGKKRTFDAALELGGYFAKAIRNPRELGNERQIGWSLISLLPVYEATWDAKYFNSARDTVNRLLEGLEPKGKFQIRWDNRISFFNGIAATGFIYYYRATGDERVAEAALKVLDRTRGMLPEYAGRTLEALAWAFDRTGDQRYLEELKITYEVTMAKQVTWNTMELSAPTIFTVHALPFLARSGLVKPPEHPLKLTAEQFSSGENLHARHLPNATGAIYLDFSGADSHRLVIVRKGAWKASGEAKLYAPDGQLLQTLPFPKEVTVWQRKEMVAPAGQRGVYRLELKSERVLNSKGGSYVTWDVANAEPTRSVFTTEDFAGLEFATPFLYFLPDPNAEKIELEFTAEGEGFKKASIIDPDGVVAGATEAFIDLGDKSRYSYKVTAPIAENQRGKLWSLSLLDARVTKISGIKPWFSTSPLSYFDLGTFKKDQAPSMKSVFQQPLREP